MGRGVKEKQKEKVSCRWSGLVLDLDRIPAYYVLCTLIAKGHA